MFTDFWFLYNLSISFLLNRIWDIRVFIVIYCLAIFFCIYSSSYIFLSRRCWYYLCASKLLLRSSFSFCIQFLVKCSSKSSIIFVMLFQMYFRIYPFSLHYLPISSAKLSRQSRRKICLVLNSSFKLQWVEWENYLKAVAIFFLIYRYFFL